MKKIPFKYQTMNEGVSFILKDREGNIIDNEILPPCTEFSHVLAHRIFAGCNGIMKSAGVRYGVLEVLGRNNAVRQRIDFDTQLYREWFGSLR